MADERYTSDETTDEIDDHSGSSFFSNTGTLPLGLPSRAGDEQRPDEYGDQPHDRPRGQGTADETSAGQTGSGDGSWAEEGIATLLIVVGVVLFLFPEPATSAVGMLLVAAGAVLWLVDWLG